MNKLKYWHLTLGTLILFAALFFPQIYPYHSWINKRVVPALGIDMPVPIFRMIGDVFYPFFLLIVPLIFVLYFSDKYLNQEKSRMVFLKLPVIALLVSVLGYFFSLFLAKEFDVCPGECFGVPLAFMFTVPAFIVFSLICSGIIYRINKKESATLAKEKINNLVGKYLFPGFFVSAVVLLLFSAILSYNCGTLLTERYGERYEDCQNHKLFTDEAKNFFSEKFPPRILNLKRYGYVSARRGRDSEITWFLLANKYGYGVRYQGEKYSYSGMSGNIAEIANRYGIMVLLYKNNEDINKVMSVVRKEIKEHGAKSGPMPKLINALVSKSAPTEVKEVNGNRIFCVYSSEYSRGIHIYDVCFWYNANQNYIVEIRAGGPHVWRSSAEGKKYQEEFLAVIKFVSDMYPSSKDADYTGSDSVK